MAIVRVHHPNLTQEEQERREEQIKKSLVEFYKQVTKEKKQWQT